MKKAMTLIIACLMLATVFGACFSVSAAITHSGFGTLEGTVKRWGGGPLENAYVYIVGGHINLEEFDISVVFTKEQTDAEGKYRVIDAPVGLYTILVLRNGTGSITDGWFPGFRHTSVRPGETTIENFELVFLKSNEQVNTVSQVQQMQACLI